MIQRLLALDALYECGPLGIIILSQNDYEFSQVKVSD
jgi:hypothetical protein